jgi:hypothetical protein
MIFFISIIDDWVYKLYGITEKERKAIEGKQV